MSPLRYLGASDPLPPGHSSGVRVPWARFVASVEKAGGPVPENLAQWARAVGCSHRTVLRWHQSGVPVASAAEARARLVPGLGA